MYTRPLGSTCRLDSCIFFPGLFDSIARRLVLSCLAFMAFPLNLYLCPPSFSVPHFCNALWICFAQSRLNLYEAIPLYF